MIVRASTVAGEIIVEWPAATGAENYRVTRRDRDPRKQRTRLVMNAGRASLF
jgi:hypothetical protein